MNVGFGKENFSNIFPKPLLARSDISLKLLQVSVIVAKATAGTNLEKIFQSKVITSLCDEVI